MLRNLLIRSLNVNLTDREVHTTTITNTLCQTNELNRNADSDRLLVIYLIEIYVKQCICYWVELKLFENCSVSLTINNQLNNVDMWCVNQLTQL